MLAPYRQREILEITVFSFGVMQKVQNFRANSGPFRPTLEKNVWNNFDLESSQLSKNVRNLKIWHILAFWTTLKYTLLWYTITSVVLTFSFFWSFQQPFPWPLFDKAFTHSFQEDSMGKCYKWRRHKKIDGLLMLYTMPEQFSTATLHTFILATAMRFLAAIFYFSYS